MQSTVLLPAALRFSRFRRSRLAAALAAAYLFGAGAVQALVITETEPNDTLGTANLTVAGNEFRGEADRVNSQEGPDFLGFIGLTPSTPYKLTLAHIIFPPGNPDNDNGEIFFDLYFNGSSTSTQTESFDGPGSQDFFFNNLSELRIGARIDANCCEGYSIALVQTSGVVPEPATAALVAAGLIGAFAARRRRRNA
jgi:hypothetical protein